MKHNRGALLNHIKFQEMVKASARTQEEVAEELDISDRYLRLLAAQDRDISVSLAYRISRTFSVSIEELLIVK